MLRHTHKILCQLRASQSAVAKFSTAAKSVTYSEHGKITKVLKVTEQNLADPSGSEVLIKMLAAPINPADFNMVRGGVQLCKRLHF